MNKIYIIRKYVIANSASQAIRKEKFQKVDDVWVDESTQKDILFEQLKKNETGFKK
jgi:hypothetical protein